MPADDPTNGVQPARRLHGPGLRDPRLVIGVVVMGLSVIAGSLVLGDHAAAHTALVLRHRVHAGEALGEADVRPAPVDLADRRSSVRYFLDGARLRGGSSADRELAAGELLPRSAVSADGDRSLTELPLSVAVDDLPATVHVGSTVDVWVLPESAKADVEPRAELVLDEVPVVRIGGDGGALAPQSTRQVIVGVDGAAGLGRILGRAASGRVLITRRG